MSAGELHGILQDIRMDVPDALLEPLRVDKSKHYRAGSFGRCPRTAGSQASAAPPSSVMNSRLLFIQ
jgi:hypothetical protein